VEPSTRPVFRLLNYSLSTFAVLNSLALVCFSQVQSSWWIYWIGPFLASFAVAEVTTWLEWDVDSTDEENNAAAAEATQEEAKEGSKKDNQENA